jgi:hypothetical protein
MKKPKKKEKAQKKAKPREEKSTALAMRDLDVVDAPAAPAGDLTRPEASALSEAMKMDLASAEGNIIAFAIKLKRFIAGKGWLSLGYAGLTEYREAELSFSEFYNARAAVKLLDAGVSPDDVRRMKLSNMQTLVRQLPEAEWKDAKVIDLAQGPIATFTQFAEKKSQEMGLAIERREPRWFRVPKSVAENWDLALNVAQYVDGCETFEQRIEAIVASYLNSESEIPGKSRLELYRQATEKKAS